MKHVCGILIVFFSLGLLLTAPTSVHAIDAIEQKTEALKRAAEHDDATPQMMKDLQEAIKQGETASARLRAELQAVEKEKQALRDEVQKLEKVQTILASGLIGVLVTAGVAILGILTNVRRSRAARDLKRLEVLEKAADLQAKGITIPGDIQSDYGVATSR